MHVPSDDFDSVWQRFHFIAAHHSRYDGFPWLDNLDVTLIAHLGKLRVSHRCPVPDAVTLVVPAPRL